MEIGKKTIAAGIGLFFLGGFSVYLIMASHSGAAPAPTASQQPAAMQEAIAHLRANNAANTPETTTSDTTAADTTISGTTTTSSTSLQTEEQTELTHDEFLAQAEARREQRLIDEAEAERLAKLRAIKEKSMECKFWKQQQKTSSATAKIEEKIIQYCTLQTSSAAHSSNGTEHSANNADMDQSGNNGQL